MKTQLIYSLEIPFSIKTVFQWFCSPCAFERLYPKSLKCVQKMQIIELIENKKIVLQQAKGAFSHFQYEYLFFSTDSKKTHIEHRVSFELPLFLKVRNRHVRNTFLNLFEFQKRVLLNDLSIKEKYPLKPQRIAVSGSNGMIGSALTHFLKAQGHTVIPIVRNKIDEGIFYDPEEGNIEKEKCEHLDALIHLGGYSPVRKLNKKEMEKIQNSRIKSTKLLVDTINQLKKPPKTFLCASGGGFYGSMDKSVTESDEKGRGFWPEFCQQWEGIALRAKTRVINLRIGAVLAKNSALLKSMLRPFKLGLGGKIGNGRSMFNWIALDDVLYSIYFCLYQTKIQGPVNIVSKEHITNYEFSKSLAQTLKRPLWLRYPAWIFKAMFKEFAEVTVLCKTTIIPKKLQDLGFTFAYPNLSSALKHILQT
ncbi:MAG: Epimerase family protein [Chlamydiae bacterium]|nr:Epimerase family protein [Chlamydiota bacterium]